MLAVLMDAIRILRQPVPQRSTGYRAWLDERQWLDSEEHVRPFAFVSICNYLGIEPEYVRRCVANSAHMSLPMNGRRYAAKTEQMWDSLRGPRRSHVAADQAATDTVTHTSSDNPPLHHVSLPCMATAIPRPRPARHWERGHRVAWARREDQLHPRTADAAALPVPLSSGSMG